MDNHVDSVFSAAGSGDISAGRALLAARWGITNQALQGFRRKGYLPLDKAKDAAQLYELRLRDLVSPELRDAMVRDSGVSNVLD